jgi:hypothetical protein
MNEIGPDVVEAVGYVLSAHAKDTQKPTEGACEVALSYAGFSARYR